MVQGQIPAARFIIAWRKRGFAILRRAMTPVQEATAKYRRQKGLCWPTSERPGTRYRPLGIVQPPVAPCIRSADSQTARRRFVVNGGSTPVPEQIRRPGPEHTLRCHRVRRKPSTATYSSHPDETRPHRGHTFGLSISKAISANATPNIKSQRTPNSVSLVELSSPIPKKGNNAVTTNRRRDRRRPKKRATPSPPTTMPTVHFAHAQLSKSIRGSLTRQRATPPQSSQTGSASPALREASLDRSRSQRRRACSACWRSHRSYPSLSASSACFSRWRA